jgi:hypothetical protein
MKVYARLCPPDLPPQDREHFLILLDRLDEDGMETFFSERPLDPQIKGAVQVLKEARDLGERINVLDRTLPVLPHVEITECYNRLRALGGVIGDLEATGVLK